MEENKVVRDYWLEGRGWDRNLLLLYLPQQLVDHLELVVVGNLGTAADRPRWSLEGTGIFSSKSARVFLDVKGDTAEEAKWKRLWKGPMRRSIILWQARWDRL